ncbi:MAG TPA: DinB family protein [Candidatus Dormibacteraeota bacterium]|nr:DinB family protein [Candidatus Dormibacteraeota bacterium]
MPFAYFQRLTRRQQAIYLDSDGIVTMPLPQAPRLQPLVTALARALESGERAHTESAAQRLVLGLARALGAPPVRVKVLAARPHARWGELHGLYETTRGGAAEPLITLWMRTARQKRVVAFRTFLRTLLHEVGHHVDYTLLRLGDSFHTQGFYARESHLFHQLVTDGGILMASLEEQMARMDRTADDFVAAIKGVPDAALSKRPDDKNWSPKEVICHMRDTEESFMMRFLAIMEMDEPRFLPVEPDRWATERQYQRNDAGEALQAFRVRREESLRFLRGLRAEHWDRGGLHATRGRMTLTEFVGLMAWHDDNHLDQLKRALQGKP